MDRRLVVVAVTAAILIGCAAGIVAHQYIAPPVAAQVLQGQQWEHICTNLTWEEFDGAPVKSDLGQQGYEMATMVHVLKPGFTATNEIYVCFKRQVTYK